MKKALLCVADTKYLKHYVVTISSLIENCSNFDLDVKILSVNTDVQTEDLLLYYFRSKFKNVLFDVIHLSEDQKETAKTFPVYNRQDKNVYVTETTLYKIFGIETLKNIGYDKCLYMDPDIFVDKNVDDLIGTILENVKKIAAVKSDFHLAQAQTTESFNAGLMLFNLTAFTQEDFSTFKIYAATEGNIFGDQWIFNKMYSAIFENVDSTFNSSKRTDFSAKVMHFTGSLKPWKTTNYFIDPRMTKYIKYSNRKNESFIDYGLGYLIENN